MSDKTDQQVLVRVDFELRAPAGMRREDVGAALQNWLSTMTASAVMVSMQGEDDAEIVSADVVNWRKGGGR